MKKSILILFATLALLSVSLSSSALAKTVADGESDNVSYTTTTGNVQAAGDKLLITNPVNGDLLIAGGELTIKAPVRDNLIIAGGAILIDTEVQGDVIAAGGVIIINGNVGGDVRVFGGDIYINSATIKGDLIAYGGQIHLAKGLVVSGEQLVNKDENNTNRTQSVFTDVTDNPTQLNDSRVQTRLNMYYPFGTGSTVKVDTKQFESVFATLNFFFSAIWMFGGIILGYFVIRTFPVFSEKTMNTMKKNPMPSTMYGCGLFVLAIPAGIILLLTVVGIPLAFFLALLAGLAKIMAGIYVNYLIGRFLLAQGFKVTKGKRLLAMAMGFAVVEVALWVIGLVPFVGGLVTGLFGLFSLAWGMGAMAYNKHQALK